MGSSCTKVAQTRRTLSRDLVNGRIVDTTTLYHVTAILSYHVAHQLLLLNKIQSFM